MSNAKNGTRSWWIFYPFKGLDINDKRPDFKRLLFTDATIFSKSHIPSIVKRFKNKRDVAFKNFPIDLEAMMKNNVFNSDFDSFIAVRRSGEYDEKKWDNKLTDLALDRAKETSALLGLYFFMINIGRKTCGLVNEHTTIVDNVILLDEHVGAASIRIQGNRSLIINSPDRFQISKSNLIKSLNQPLLKNWSSCFFPGSNRIKSKSIRESILRSSCRLKQVFYSTNDLEKILGVITSLEILLSEELGKQDDLKNRIECLIGSTAKKELELDKVFELRNAFVHKGKTEKSIEIVFYALNISICCLLAVSNLATKFKQRTDMLKYLDFVYRSKKYLAPLNKELGKKLVFHKDGGFIFPFVNDLLSTLPKPTIKHYG